MRKLITTTLFACLLALAYTPAYAQLDDDSRARQEEVLAKKEKRKLYKSGIRREPSEKRYSIGDTYTYDNPQTAWQITDIIGDRLLWESELGELMETSMNPFLPAFAWESERYGQGRRSITQIRGKLFPLRKGKTMKFVESISINGKRRSWSWRCVVGEKQKTNTTVGIFDTVAVLCQRVNGEALIYRYSPVLSRVVEFRTSGLGAAPLTKRSLIGYSSSAGTVYQSADAGGGRLNLPLKPLPPDPDDEDSAPYIPELAPIKPLPFAQPPADFFAPQRDSKPETDSSKTPASDTLKRILKEELERQKLQQAPVLEQFAPASPPEPESAPPESGSQETPTEPEPPDESSNDANDANDANDDASKAASPQSENNPGNNPENNSNTEPKPTTSAVILGEYPSLSQAREEWQKFNRDFATLFNGRRYDIIRRNDDAQGIVYALYAHPYINDEAARDVCTLIRKKYRRSSCGVVAWQKGGQKK